jgi:twinkle protein
MMIKPITLLPQLNILYNTGISKGYATGWDDLDELFTVKPGEFTVLTGMPSHGKSEWLDNLLVNLAINHNFRIAIFSPENHPLELHASKIIEKYATEHFFNTPHGNRMNQDDMMSCLDLMNRNFGFVVPKETAFTPIDIINDALPWLEQSAVQPRLLVVDPWNEMDHYRPAGLTETEYISRVLTELRRAARDYNTHLVLVAHPMKMNKDKEGNYPVPRPYDISGSAHWYNKADNCIAVWRDVQNNPERTEIHIQKVRFKGTGKPGMQVLMYNRTINTFQEPREFNSGKSNGRYGSDD